ncbi:MAG: acetyl-CoA carboxylase biotin carboxyl carrier protein [Planctomycetota bacterium]
MIDIRKLKELVKLMVENDLTELDLQDQEETVSLKRGVGGAVMPAYAAPAALAPVAAPAPAAADSAPAPASGGSDDGLVAIESPMVGTFYSAANPDSPPFVSVGESVSADTVVCIVEAMKVFNEIKAEASGTIAKVLVENGAAVEFGQPLFMIKPN